MNMRCKLIASDVLKDYAPHLKLLTLIICSVFFLTRANYKLVQTYLENIARDV